MATIYGSKSGYHHGDLRNALIAAAAELAAEGGPDKVVLREAARRVGVSPAAAYRHFQGQGDLLLVVALHCHDRLADAMERAVAASDADAATAAGDPGERAERRVRALGRGYVGFALENPGLYRTAFGVPKVEEVPGEGPVYRSYALLSEALDGLVAAGRMAAGDRAGAEVVAWSAVHGLSLLVIDGLSGLSEEEWVPVVERTVAVTVAGLAAGRALGSPADTEGE
ncbi:WHG domain-containing protein [Streptomyces sp. NPDC050504]|uniref:TetR/AcrR family transcriptional regulator n=1 Tax=Streptomyces sp. NPDC050504 TaxID=3365618 RepID=UPI0037A5988D